MKMRRHMDRKFSKEDIQRFNQQAEAYPYHGFEIRYDHTEDEYWATNNDDTELFAYSRSGLKSKIRQKIAIREQLKDLEHKSIVLKVI